MWNVGSSSTILCSAPESLASSPRLLGVAARPTIGVGNFSGGITERAERRAGVQIFGLGHGHDIARPGGVDRMRFAALHFEQRADFEILARAGGMHDCRPS